MKNTILTITIIACFQFASFAQATADLDMSRNVELVNNTVADKSDITGTITNAGGWNMFIDDAKVEINEKVVKKFSNKDMQSLVQSGYSYAMKNKSKNICYKYRITTNQDGSQNMALYECGF